MDSHSFMHMLLKFERRAVISGVVTSAGKQREHGPSCSYDKGLSGGVCLDEETTTTRLIHRIKRCFSATTCQSAAYCSFINIKAATSWHTADSEVDWFARPSEAARQSPSCPSLSHHTSHTWLDTSNFEVTSLQLLYTVPLTTPLQQTNTDAAICQLPAPLACLPAT